MISCEIIPGVSARRSLKNEDTPLMFADWSHVPLLLCLYMHALAPKHVRDLGAISSPASISSTRQAKGVPKVEECIYD